MILADASYIDDESEQHTDVEDDEDLQPNNIYQMDSLKGKKKMKKSSVDLVVTSPPYSDMKKYASGFAGVHPDKYVDWFMPFVSEIDRILKKTGSFILNINDKVVDGFRHTFVFDLVGAIVRHTGLKLYERFVLEQRKVCSKQIQVW